MWETVSSTFVFGFYKDGVVVRDFWILDGEVNMAEGDPLPGEPALSDVFIDDVMELMARVGPSVDAIEASDHLLHLQAESTEKPSALERAKMNAHWPGHLRMMTLARKDEERFSTNVCDWLCGRIRGSGMVELSSALGLHDAAVGDQRSISATAGELALSGTVEMETNRSPHLLMRLDHPARGFAIIGVFTHEDRVHTSIELRLLDDEVLAAREAAWRAWMDARFPPARTSS